MKLIKKFIEDVIGLIVLLIIINVLSGGRLADFVSENIHGSVNNAVTESMAEPKGPDMYKTDDSEIGESETKEESEEKESGTAYDLIKKSLRQEIDSLKKQQDYDPEELGMAYAALFDLYTEEYLFKCNACTEYYPDVDFEKKYSSVLGKCQDVVTEMKKIYEDEYVERLFYNIAIMQNRVYQSMEFPDRNEPDIDALWLEYCEVLIKQEPFAYFYAKYADNQ